MVELAPVVQALADCVELIQDEKVKKLVLEVIDEAGSDLTRPSSSTGLYHPKDEICEYGIIKHMLKAVSLALWGLRRIHPVQVKLEDIDILIATALIHDHPYRSCYDETEKRLRTNLNHAIDGAEFTYVMGEEIGVDLNYLEPITVAQALHMGRWADYQNPKYQLIRPLKGKDYINSIIQEADYYSTRRNVMVDYSISSIAELVNNLREEIKKVHREDMLAE